MKNKAFKIMLLVALVVFAVAGLSACSAIKDLANEFSGKNDVASVSYIKSVNGIESQYRAGATIDYASATVSVVYSDGSEKTVQLEQTSYDTIDTLSVGDHELSVLYKGAVYIMNVRIYVDVTVTKLSTPTGLKVDGNKLSWTAVRNASGYKVYINGREYESSSNSYVFNSQQSGTITFAVMAVSGSAEFENSDVSSDLRVENMIQLAAPSDIKIDRTVLSWTYEGQTSDIYFVVKQDGGIAVQKTTDTSLDLLSLNLGASDKPYSFSVYACSTDSKKMQSDVSASVGFKVTRLEAPKSFAIKGRILSWEKNSKAVKYRITVGENEISAESNIDVGAASGSFDIASYFGQDWFTKPAAERVGSYSFKIKALGYTAENAKTLEKVSGDGYEYEWLLDSVATESVNYKVVQLTSPYGLYIEDGKLHWSGDANAEKYNVYVAPDGKQQYFKTTTDTQIDLSDADIKDSNRYVLYVVAIGGSNNSIASEVIDSAASATIEYVYKTPLAAPTLTLSGNTLTWNTVENAGSYLLCTQRGAEGKPLSTTRKSLTADFLSDLGYGSFDFYVIALPKKDGLYTNSAKSNEVNFVHSTTLSSPVVSVNGTAIEWKSVENAEFYTLTVSGEKAEGSACVPVVAQKIKVEGKSYDLSVLGAGSYTVTVTAENSDSEVFKASSPSAEVPCTVTSKLKAPVSVNVNSDGNIEYSLVDRAVKYFIEIYDADSFKQFECFNTTVSGTNGLYDFVDFLEAGNTMKAGVYRIDIRAYASDAVAKYVTCSDIKSYNLRVSSLASVSLTVGTRQGAFGDTDFGREISWNAVKNALGYNVYVDGAKVNSEVVLATKFTLSESSHLTAGKSHKIEVVAVGNGKNVVNSKASAVSLTLPSALPIDADGKVTVVPSNLRIEGGMLKWDCVDADGIEFADSYTLFIEYLVDGGENQQDSVEVFGNSYTDFVTNRNYTVSVAANVKFSSGEKTIYSSDRSAAYQFRLKAAINAGFADDTITWQGSSGTEYKIFFGDVAFSHIARNTGTQMFDVKEAVKSLDAGVYELRIAEVSSAGGMDIDNVYNRFSVITVLETPSVVVSGSRITWDAVASAEKYIVTIDGVSTDVGSNTYVDGVMLPEGSSVVRVQAVSTQSKIYSSKVSEQVIEKIAAPNIANDQTTITWTMEAGITYRIYDLLTNSAYTVDLNTPSEGSFTNEGGKAYLSDVTDLSTIEISATKEGFVNADTWSYPKADEAAAAYGIEYGAGTIGVPYIIGNAQQFAALEAFENTYFKVTADLDLGEHKPFDFGTGNVVDFRGHTVTFTVNQRAEQNAKVGLFKVNNGTVKNVKINATISLVNTSVSSYGSVVAGAVAGINNGVVEDVYVSGTVEGTTYVGGVVGRNNGVVTSAVAEVRIKTKSVGLSVPSYVGSIVGYNVNGTIEGCSSNEYDVLGYLLKNYTNTENDLTNVTVYAYSTDANIVVGGVLGMSEGSASIISDSYSYDNVCGVSTKGNVYAGGLGGWLKDGATVSDCLATGNAVSVSESGNAYAAGFVAASKAEYSFCYSMGMPVANTTSGQSGTGGFIARRVGGSDPEYCYYNVDTSGIEPVSTFDKALAITTLELKYMQSFGVENDKWVFAYNYDNRPIFFPHLVSERWLLEYDEATGRAVYTSDLEKGLGTVENPIQIKNGAPLMFMLFAKNTDYVFLMVDDIDFSVMDVCVQINTFTANVWGDGHTLKGSNITGGSELGLIKRNYGNFYGVTISDFVMTSSTREGVAMAGAFAAYNAGMLIDCKVENGKINLTSLTDSAYVGAFAGINTGIICSNEERADLVKGDPTTYSASVGEDVELLGQSKFGKYTIIGTVVGLNKEGYIRCVDAKASVRPVGTNYFKGGICGQNVQPTDELGINIDNVIDCFYSEEKTLCSETDNLWGTAY